MSMLLRLEQARWLVFVAFSALVAFPPSALARPSQTRTPIPVKTEEMHSLTFSNLVFRIKDDADLAVAKDGYRVDILEELRKYGYPALGAENVVFNQDKASEARFVLGGTARELDCARTNGRYNCGVGIEWELLDHETESVVYRVTTRHYELDLESESTREGNVITISVKDVTTVARHLFLGALRSAMSRPAFVTALRKGPGNASASPTQPSVALQTCTAAEVPMPESSEKVLRATVLVEAGDSLGSGVLVSPDGFIVTAAHVVGDKPARVQLRDGTTHDAKLIRVRKDRDVALLKIEGAPGVCLPARKDTMTVGADLFAIGSAASKELAFSLTRGIVSGTRELDGVQFLQTDASINPGNSGGPLVDASGRLAAIVTLKLVGETVEGVAFGVPIQAALQALAVTGGDHTDPVLLTALATTPVAATQAFVDKEDESESLDPEGDHRRAVHKATPGYVHAMRWTGLGLVVVGSSLAGLSYLLYQDGRSTKDEFESARLKNDLGWVGAGVGALMFGASWFLVPHVPNEKDKKTDAKAPTVRASFGGTRADLWVRF